MPRRLFLALLLLVAAPMVLLGWMSASAFRANQVAAKESLATLLSSQLYDADRKISQLFDRYADRLNSELDTETSLFDTLRRLRREVPIVRQGIYVDQDGLMLFPSPDDSVGVDAAEVAAALPGLIDARPLPSRAFDNNPSDTKTPKGTPTSGKGPFAGKSQSSATPTFTESAWQQWYMADGAQVVYWRTRSDGATIGVLLERSRWIADLIAVLPDDRNRDVSASAVGLSLKHQSRYQWTRHLHPTRTTLRPAATLLRHRGRSRCGEIRYQTSPGRRQG